MELLTRDIKIQTGEYFWDTDPGQGSGTSLVAIDGNFNQAVEEMLSSSITLPTQGIHVLSIRLKDENGFMGKYFFQGYYGKSSAQHT